MSKKVVVILLVLTGVLFVLALGSNWLPSSQLDEASFDPGDSWVSGLGEVLSPFDKSVPASRLTPRARCRVGAGRYRLTDNNPCDINVAPAIGSGGEIEEANRSLVLEIREDIVINVPCRETSQSRGLNPRRVMKLKRQRAKVSRTGRVSGAGRNKIPLLAMDLRYIANGDAERPPLDCTHKSPAKLVVFGEGGMLQLKCPTCTRNRSIDVTLK